MGDDILRSSRIVQRKYDPDWRSNALKWWERDATHALASYV